MARYVIDAPTLLQLVADGVEVARSHQLVAPNAIRTEALALLLAAVRRGDLTEHAALAEHVAVCMLQADTLVTVDKAMASRAKGLLQLAP